MTTPVRVAPATPNDGRVSVWPRVLGDLYCTGESECQSSVGITGS